MATVQARVRTSLAPVLVLLSACITNRIGPGVLRQDWNQRPRDLDPMHNPAAPARDNRWDDEREQRIPGPGEAQPPSTGEAEAATAEEDSPAVDLVKRSVATALAVGAAGWLPILESSGTFEEDPATRALHRQRAQRAERARAERRKRRIERAPAPVTP